ncbi:MAG: DUF2723 domain-containing protein [Pontiellaceae bacterium]|nr:DUF2723 domain-containing protein [Pontiellaceae bacterium]
MPEKFFRKTDWIACWTTFVIALIAYALTLQPTVGLEDSGELIVASDYLGVPHPPGYPSWTLLTWFFQRIFNFVTYHGQPNPAWAVNFFSAFAGAAACGTIALLISRSGRDLFFGLTKNRETLTEKNINLFTAVAGVVGGLLLAFGQGMWSQSVITEVYTLNVFFEAILLLFLYRWMVHPDQTKWLIVCSFAVTLAFTNHQTAIILGAAIAIAVLFRDQKLFRDFAIVGTILLVLYFVVHSRMIDNTANELLEKLEKLPGTIRTQTHADQQARYLKFSQCAWRNGPEYAAFWTFLIPILLTPILIAIRPRLKNGAIIWMGLILIFIGIDLSTKIRVERVGHEKTELKLNQFEQREQIEKLEKMRIFSMHTEIEIIPESQNSKSYIKKYEFKGIQYPPFTISFCFLFAVPFMLALRLPNGRIVCLACLAMMAGLAFYLYMPLSSDQNPPINWGYPRTWKGLVHAFSRGQYDHTHPKLRPLTETAYFIEVLKYFFANLKTQYAALILAGFLPFTAWRIKRFNAAYLGIGLFLFGAAFMTAGKLVSIQGKLPQLAEQLSQFATPFTIGLFLLFFVGLCFCISNFIEYCNGQTKLLFKGEIRKPWDITAVILVIFVGMGLLAGLLIVDAYLVKYLLSPVLSHTAWFFQLGIALIVLATLPGLVLAAMGSNVLIAKSFINTALPGWMIISIYLVVILPPLTIFGTYLLKRWKRTELKWNYTPLNQHWLMTTAVAYIMVGIGFIILQNPDLDLQSLFIQHVQYLLSHAVFVIWIGYGILLLMAELSALLKDRSWARIGIVVAVLCLPALLIAKNAKDTEQHLAYGRADQNGRDFGWHFGNWQLEGVAGIERDMRDWYSPEEFEKVWANYPNKNYPEPMEQNAIFFGGTDPGRFVPTYMIYSAKVRPDVYLITQNALADDTYLDVMRDLYGDQIWIPSGLDLKKAFTLYSQKYNVEGTGGRLVVEGADAVMKINAFLTQMIFDYNQFRTETKTDEKTRQVGSVVVHADPVVDPQTGLPPQRSFYIEESSAIEWMYPYLSPNGLIMKINNEPTLLSQEMIDNDMAFWDWYAERLTSDEKFTKDIPAGKTFSKLRSSIAELYRQNPRSVFNLWKDQVQKMAAESENINKKISLITEEIATLRQQETAPSPTTILQMNEQIQMLTNHAIELRKEQDALTIKANELNRKIPEYDALAEKAYLQALKIYPYSQEVNQRLIVLWATQGKNDEAIKLVDNLLAVDKHHKLGPLKIDLELQKSGILIDRYVREQDPGKIDGIAQEWLMRIDQYEEELARSSAEGRINILGRNSRIAQRFETILNQTKRTEMEKSFSEKYDDIMIDLALVYLSYRDEKKREALWPVLNEAVKHGGTSVQNKLKTDRRFKSIWNDLRFKELLIKIP